MKSFYEILEVSPSASAAEIRTAYLNLAREYHPDRIPEHLTKLRADAEEKLKQMNQAWAVLGDPVKRRLYDLGARESYGSHDADPPRPAPVQPKPSGRLGIRDLLLRRKDVLKLLLVIAIMTLVLVVFGELIAFRGSGDKPGSSVSSNVPPTGEPLSEKRVFHYDLRPLHLRGGQGGGGLDVQLTSVSLGEKQCQVSFRLRAGEHAGFLLYEPAGARGRTRDVLGKQVAVDRDLEEIYLLDDAGVKYYSTTGLSGGKQVNFDLYNFTRRINLAPREDVVLTATFPPLSGEPSSVTFVSPPLMKWQSEWRWAAISLK
jgi:hypothetical protein